MADSLGTLLSKSWKFFTSHLKPIAIGVVVFGVLSFGAQFVLQIQAMGAVESQLGDMQNLEELAERIEAGDTAALEEAMNQMGLVDETGAMNQAIAAEKGIAVLKGTLPSLGLFILFTLIVSILQVGFFLSLAIDGSLDAKAAFARSPKLFFPLLFLWIWMFLRSFLWIPILGFILVIIIGPRLFLAPVILVKEGKGVFESTKESYSATRGYWGKIVGNSIVVGLCIMMVVIVIGMLVGMISLGSALLGGFLMVLLQGAIVAYGYVFHVQLAETILSNRLQPAGK